MKLKTKRQFNSRPGQLVRVSVAFAVLVAGLSVLACSVPVFRYALERWAPDPYGVVVFHRGDLSAEQRLLIEGIDSAKSDRERIVNTSTHAVDLERDLEPAMRKLWEAQGTETVPWMVVLNPRATLTAGTVWAGELSKDSVAKLADSPARREIARKLVTGTTAAWVLLESGNAEQDDAAELRLKTRLIHLEKELKIQELDPQDVADGLVSAAQERLKVSFSTLRLSRTDPAESFFVNMLLETEGDLKDFDEPIAIPVFGQGRALYALIGDGINDNMIDETAAFLVGPCSCEVKEQNPGMDLVFSVDWNSLVRSIADVDREPPPLSGFLDGEVETRPPPSLAVAETSDSNLDVTEPFVERDGSEAMKMSPVIRNAMVVVIVTLLGVIGAGFLFLRAK